MAVVEVVAHGPLIETFCANSALCFALRQRHHCFSRFLQRGRRIVGALSAVILQIDFLCVLLKAQTRLA